MDLELKFEIKIEESKTVGGGFVASFKDFDLRGFGRSENMALYALFFNLIYSKEILYDVVVKAMIRALTERLNSLDR